MLLWALGVGAVISGDFFGWNFGLAAGGFWGLTIATVPDGGRCTSAWSTASPSCRPRCRTPAASTPSRATPSARWAASSAASPTPSSTSSARPSSSSASAATSGPAARRAGLRLVAAVLRHLRRHQHPRRRDDAQGRPGHHRCWRWPCWSSSSSARLASGAFRRELLFNVAARSRPIGTLAAQGVVRRLRRAALRHLVLPGHRAAAAGRRGDARRGQRHAAGADLGIVTLLVLLAVHAGAELRRRRRRRRRSASRKRRWTTASRRSSASGRRPRRPDAAGADRPDRQLPLRSSTPTAACCSPSRAPATSRAGSRSPAGTTRRASR